MKLKIGVILLIMIIVLIIPVWTYEPLTNEEIKLYWSTLTEDEKIEEIRKLDIIEHSIPIIKNVNYIALLTKNGDLIIYPNLPIIMNISYLSYEIEMPQYLIEDFIEIKEEKKKYVLSAISGILIGVLSTAATGEENYIKYIINSIIGILIGVSYEYFR